MKTESSRECSAVVRTAALPPILIACLAAACTPGDGAGVPEYQARDSAGIEIVQSGPPLFPDSAAWRVDPEPILQIGKSEGELPYLFSRVRDAVRMPDGRIAVLEGQDLEIRVFGPDGTHRGSFGRQGDGPLEFEVFPQMALAPPDTLVVWDQGHARLSWFDPTGTLLRQRSFPEVMQRLSIVPRGAAWRVWRDGSLLATRPVRLSRDDELEDRGFHLSAVDDAGESSHTFGVFPSGQMFDHPMGFGFSTWFSPAVQCALGPPSLRVAVSSPEEWEIRFFSSDGGLRRILRAPISRVPVTEETHDARRAYNEDIALRIGLTRGDAEDIDAAMPVPDSLPAIARMRWDRVDHLWVGRRLANPMTVEAYDVFDTAGHWITTVRIPPELGYIQGIGDDYVLMLWRDDLDVSYLRLYRLEKGGF